MSKSSLLPARRSKIGITVYKTPMQRHKTFIHRSINKQKGYMNDQREKMKQV